MERASYSVPAAARAAKIVKLLSKEPLGLRMVDVARIIEINISTCHNILRTLCDEGILYYDNRRKNYLIGYSMIYSIGRMFNEGLGVAPVMKIMQDLSDRTSMTAVLADAINLKRIRMLSSTHPTGMMSLMMTEFETVPILSGSMGRVVAAWEDIPRETLHELFVQSAHEGDFSFDEFMQDVDAAKTHGWAIDNGTWQRGIWGIAAPVPNPANQVEQILCLICAAGAIAPDKVPEIGQALVQTAHQIGAGNL